MTATRQECRNEDVNGGKSSFLANDAESLSDFLRKWEDWLLVRKRFFKGRESDFMRGPITLEERITYLENDVDGLLPAIGRLLTILEANTER
jgi:hypothetical protein